MKAWSHVGVLVLVLVSGCASIERPHYGVEGFEIRGAEAMDGDAIERCLLTRERESFALILGLGSRECNEPPFDSSTPRLRLWRWPWTDWSSFNPAVLEQDLRRVERWYRARGFYDARVIATTVTPRWANEPGQPAPAGECSPEHDDCTVQVVVVIHEGAPLRVGRVELVGHEQLAPALKRRLQSLEALPRAGQRFDEVDHDRAKQALTAALTHASHAGASVGGEIRLDRSAGRVHLRYQIVAGPAYRFGTLSVHGARVVPVAPIVAAADLKQGSPYDDVVLDDIRKQVHALGAFSAVEVEHVLDPQRAIADVRVAVTPVKTDAFRVGVGVTSGQLQRTETGELSSVPQWDLHLSGMYERRHVLFGLGKLRVEDRPRMIFNQSFPGVEAPALGNIAKVSLNQVGLVERHTDLFTSVQHDYGPDAFLGFFRHDVLGRIGGRRGFLGRKLFMTLAVQQDVYRVVPGAVTSDGSPVPSNHVYDFLEQDLRLDLRDDLAFPTRGAYVGLTLAEGAAWAGSDWTSLRVAPQVRGYVPLPLGMVLAARGALAANFIGDASPTLDVLSARLGPTTYRLRGGGASSNRGFLPGELGAGPDGGLRRWELLVELRIRLGESFAFVLFSDFGDVNDGSQFRFDHLNTSLGWGLRFLTAIGAIRFDVGHRPRALRGSAPIEAGANELPLSSVLGAVHLTIGEAF